MVLCAIFGCGTRTVRDKGVYMARIPSVVTNQGDEIKIFSEERRKNGFLPSAEKTSRTAFWSTDESVVDILSQGKLQNCGIGTIQIGFQPRI